MGKGRGAEMASGRREPEEIRQLQGTVEEVVFRNEDTGYTVLEVDSDGELVTVVGEMAAIDPGEEIVAHGAYKTHPSYGYQFAASMVERSLPATESAIVKYLSSGAVKGIGPVLARRMVECFGERTLEIMEREPERLAQVKGISPAKARELAKEFQQLFGVRAVMAGLARYDLEPATCIRIWKRWGTLALELVAENPYALCCEEIGLPFEKADAIAATLELPPDSHARLSAGLAFVLRHNLLNGHTCLPEEKLLQTAAGLLEVEREKLEQSLNDAVEDNSFQADEIGGRRYIYLPEFYIAETYAAGRLRMMVMLNPPVQADHSPAIDQLEAAQGIRFAALQRRAINEAMNDNVFILTGGPGTGKTTTLNAVITLLQEQGLKVALAAPTGRAAKRMSELTGEEAKTIHRLLELDAREPAAMRFRHNEKNPLPVDVVIVDEMSMVDSLLFEALLRALRLSCRLILVGDSDQLPSVSAGNVLKDLIDSQLIPTVRLDEIFRQAAESLIVTNAHAVVRGELPDLGRKDRDFFFLRRSDEALSAQTVVELCATRLPAAYQLDPMREIQVIAPTRAGRLGTGELNRLLQQALNPPAPHKAEARLGPLLVREGDKVMQTRNNYDLVWTRGGERGMGIYNGDIGVIKMLDRTTRTLLIDFDDRMAEYSYETAQQLELAYAITVHKSQGSEFEAVVMPLMNYRSKMYFRNLFYTAITRARRMLILLGREDSVQAMVQNDRRTLRYTNLAAYLQQGDLA